MKFNPNTHHRKSIRLKGYDYSQNGAYFITICTINRDLYFEQFPELVNIINQEWQNLENRYNNIILDEFVIMPNHVHGIIFIEEMVGEEKAEKRAEVNPAPTVATTYKPFTTPMINVKNDNSKITLGDIICSFKSLCTKQWLKHIKDNNLDTHGKFWQRNYYEKIIRDESQLIKTCQYIIDNPARWDVDKLNPEYQINVNNKIQINDEYKGVGAGFTSAQNKR